MNSLAFTGMAKQIRFPYSLCCSLHSSYLFWASFSNLPEENKQIKWQCWLDEQLMANNTNTPTEYARILKDLSTICLPTDLMFHAPQCFPGFVNRMQENDFSVPDPQWDFGIPNSHRQVSLISYASQFSTYSFSCLRNPWQFWAPQAYLFQDQRHSSCVHLFLGVLFSFCTSSFLQGTVLQTHVGLQQLLPQHEDSVTYKH